MDESFGMKATGYVQQIRRSGGGFLQKNFAASFPDSARSRDYLFMEHEQSIGHDQLFKELLSTFFHEFIELFFPKLATFLDPDVIVVSLQQEILDDVARKESHIVDLLMRGKFKGQDAYFLIHIENQATAQSDFPRRMYEYFARLTLKYNLPVYPIVVFSYDKPHRAEPTRYEVTFPNKTVMRFEYDVVQLNRLPWRRFLKSDNPVATALMARMKIAPRDRPKAKAELLRILASHKLDPARARLLSLFIDRYLVMTADEMKVFERKVAGFAPAESEEVMELMTSWEIKGMERGLHEGLERGLHDGKAEMAMRQIRKRFGIITEEMASRLSQLSAEQLDELGEALFDFANVNDLEQWLARR